MTSPPSEHQHMGNTTILQDSPIVNARIIEDLIQHKLFLLTDGVLPHSSFADNFRNFNEASCRLSFGSSLESLVHDKENGMIPHLSN